MSRINSLYHYFQNQYLKKKYHFSIKKRSKIPDNNYLMLSQDIPRSSFHPFEEYSNNAFYGNSYALKKYLGISYKIPLHVSIQHGVHFGEYYWEEDLIPPVCLAWGQKTANVWKKHVNKPIYCIGSPFYYTDSKGLLNEIQIEKERIGKNLLVFPAHSSHYALVEYNTSEFIEKLQTLSKEFDSVRICLYWRDILRGIHKYYEKKYEIVTAGHIFDIFFYSRLRSLMEISDCGLGNSISSSLGYYLYLNRPYALIKSSVSVHDKERGEGDKQAEIYRQDPGYQKIIEIFENNTDFLITSEQRECIEPYWGIKEKKTKEELKKIIFH